MVPLTPPHCLHLRLVLIVKGLSAGFVVVRHLRQQNSYPPWFSYYTFVSSSDVINHGVFFIESFDSSIQQVLYPYTSIIYSNNNNANVKNMKSLLLWNNLKDLWPCASRLSVVNAIGTQLRDPIKC